VTRLPGFFPVEKHVEPAHQEEGFFQAFTDFGALQVCAAGLIGFLDLAADRGVAGLVGRDGVAVLKDKSERPLDQVAERTDQFAVVTGDEGMQGEIGVAFLGVVGEQAVTDGISLAATEQVSGIDHVAAAGRDLFPFERQVLR